MSPAPLATPAPSATPPDAVRVPRPPTAPPAPAGVDATARPGDPPTSPGGSAAPSVAPGQLAATGLRAVLSSVFGAYADRREIQAALHQHHEGPAGAAVAENAATTDHDGVHCYDQDAHAVTDDGFWIDYVADLGDGFDSTYTVAWLLAQPSLPAPAGEADAEGEGIGPGVGRGVPDDDRGVHPRARSRISSAARCPWRIAPSTCW